MELARSSVVGRRMGTSEVVYMGTGKVYMPEFRRCEQNSRGWRASRTLGVSMLRASEREE